MNLTGSRRLSIIGLFVSLAIVLNLVLKIPAPFAGFLTYELWEVPIVSSFLLFGFSVTLPVTLVNFLVLMAFPGTILAGPLYNLIAVLSMLLGVSVARKIGHGLGAYTIASLATALGILFRVLVMTPVNAILLQFPYPLGFDLRFALVSQMLAPIAFFNGTVALYTIPLAYIAVREARSRVSFLREKSVGAVSPMPLKQN